MPADIDPHEFRSLNEDFYRADPAEVIDRRLWMLVHFIADESLSVEVAGEDIALQRDEIPELDEKVRFACLESTLILHQAAETLLRLCFAHWEGALCPWAEMAKLRSPGVFPRSVSKLLDSLDADALEEAMRVISWSADQAETESRVKWKREGGWQRHRDGLQALLRYCGETVLEGADLYNAGKHGLAITPSEKGIKLESTNPSISVNGPSLTVLERSVAEGEPRWAKVVHWVKYQQAVAMTHLIATAIRSLWECGKQRRVGGGDLTRLHFFDADVVYETMQIGFDDGFVINSMSETLFDLDHPMFVRNDGAKPVGDAVRSGRSGGNR